ncbi:MAG: methyltransferase [Verrucomicrobia bacterium]|nr:methyltransferase [Verrucomicrobiota bacterium]
MNSLDLTLQPQTDPTILYRHRDALYAVDLLTAALVWLDLFTWLDTHPADKEGICRQFELTERPTDVMLTLFTAMSFLEKHGEQFHLTPLAREHLVKSSPWFIGPYYAALKDRPVCKDYLTVLRTGKPANFGSAKDTKPWAQAMEEPAFAAQFTAAMDCRGIFLGPALARALDLRDHQRFLDIAGGSGIYACCVVAAHPHLRAAVFEKPPVDQVAMRHIAQRGYADRVSVVAGDMFAEALPSGFDVHLFSNVLHDWEEPVVKQLLAKSFQALPSGGLLLVHDAHINAEKTGPLHVAEYSALLMNITEGKCYSMAEMEAYLEEVGFGRLSFMATAAARSLLAAWKP